MEGYQLLLLAGLVHLAAAGNRLSDERIIFQLGDFGQIDMALYPEARLAFAYCLHRTCSLWYQGNTVPAGGAHHHCSHLEAGKAWHIQQLSFLPY